MLLDRLPEIKEEKEVVSSSDVTREMVLREAESWIGTPFHHMGRVKGAGTDCGQVLLGIYHNVGCIPKIKTEYYPRDFHIHSTQEWYLGIVQRFAREITGLPQPGDVALFRLEGGLIFSHGAVVYSWPKVIHAIAGRRVDWGDASQGFLKGNEVKFFEPLCFKEGLSGN